MSETTEYLLGSNQTELDRLRFQHGVWKPMTDAFFDRLGVGDGWECLDVGAGPGFVTEDLIERVGTSGFVTALEPSKIYVTALRDRAADLGWRNFTLIEGTAETAVLPEKKFDLVFVRWVLNFLPDRKKFLEALARAVKPGGIIAVEDYWYEGLSVRPRGSPFDLLPDIVRRYYASAGGDAYAIGEMPSHLRPLGFSVVDITPRQQAGDRESGVYRWASLFFTQHLPLMARKGIISQEECDIQLANFARFAADPEMIFFSPIVLDCAMRKDNH